MKFIKIQSGTTIHAVVRYEDLGYKLISLHGCESSAKKAIKRLDMEDRKIFAELYKNREYRSGYSIEIFKFKDLFSHF